MMNSMQKRNAILVIGVLAASVVLASQAQNFLYINGKKYQSGYFHEGENTWIDAKALKAAGAEVTITKDRVSIQFKPLKEQMQLDAVEGVLGEFIQNEGWRVKVHSVTPAKSPFGKGTGMAVKFEWRNLTSKAMNFGTSGLRQFQLIDDAGKVLKISNSSFKDQYTAVAPGNGFTNELLFGTEPGDVSKVGKPSKILIVFGQSGKNKFKNFRIDLAQD